MTLQVITGDSKGQISIFEMSGRELVLKSQTKPSKKSLSRLSKISQKQGPRNRVMYGIGTQVRALKMSGKQYFSFDTNLTEPLKWATVEENSYVFTAGEFIINFYEIQTDSINDTFQYIAPSEILEMFIHSLDGVNYFAIVATKDRTIRVLNSEKEIYNFTLPGNANSISLWTDVKVKLDSKRETPKNLIFGLEGGLVTCYQLDQFKETHLWEIKSPNKSSVVTAKQVFITGDERADIAIARSDTTIEIYSNLAQNNSSSIFEKRGEVKIGETITTIEPAKLRPNQYEIFVSTYSGKIFGVYNDSSDMADAPVKQSSSKALQKNLITLQKEINQMKELYSQKKKTVAQSQGVNFLLI